MRKGVLLAATTLFVLVAGALVVAFASGEAHVRQITTTIPSSIVSPLRGDRSSADEEDHSRQDEAGDDRSDERGDDQAGD